MVLSKMAGACNTKYRELHLYFSEKAINMLFIDGNVMWKEVLKKRDLVMWSGLVWFRMGTSAGLFLRRQ